jgi:diketogulonate reductase-like aldo/keto reductase
MIKRAQRIYGRIFTVSGVVTAFRKEALHRVGYWSLNMVTEDIDISWKLQRDHWGILYAPNALCWILMFGAVTCAIPGGKRSSQVVENFAASDLPALPDRAMTAVREIYPARIRAGRPT